MADSVTSSSDSGMSKFNSGVQSAAAIANIFQSIFGGGGTTTTTGPVNGTQKTNQTVTKLDPQVLAFIKNQFSSGQFSKGTAITDSQNLLTNAIQQAFRDNMPSIAASAKGSGMTGDSMSQLLQQQLGIQSAIQGSTLQANLVNSYNDNLVNLLNALTVGSPTNTKSNTQSHQDAVTQTTSNNGMCFITTIICDSFGKPDDCEELMTLRKFRDNFMKAKGLEFLIEQYYKEAPAIIEIIERLPYSVQQCFFSSLYFTFIIPAITAINEGRMNDALAIYITMFCGIKELVLNLVSVE